MSQQGFWENQEKASQVVRQIKILKSYVEPLRISSKKYSELRELVSLVKDSDKDLISEIKQTIGQLLLETEKIEFQTLLNGEFDANNAILSINAGAGGTEACDWCSMLLRMYTRWAEGRGYTVKVIDILYGEEAGVKNVTCLIEGEFAYGYSKCERGVHRLVRISPFDANKRRHTSFASVDVIPEVKEDSDLKIEEKDLKIDVYRSKGAGGQSVNTTDSAVRITHIPSGIVAQCQNERSQHQNKQVAMMILKARLYEFEQLKKEEQNKKHQLEKKKIEWGSQIRSYVLQPYTLVKDLRTDYETGDTNKVLDGGINEFIEAYLRSLKTKKE